MGWKVREDVVPVCARPGKCVVASGSLVYVVLFFTSWGLEGMRRSEHAGISSCMLVTSILVKMEELVVWDLYLLFGLR